MSSRDVLLIVAFEDPELGSVQVPLPGLTVEEFAEAAWLIRAGNAEAPAVQRLLEALQRGLGPMDLWSLRDDAALIAEVAAYRNGGQFDA